MNTDSTQPIFHGEQANESAALDEEPGFRDVFTLDDGTINDIDSLMDRLEVYDNAVTPLPTDFDL